MPSETPARPAGGGEKPAQVATGAAATGALLRSARAKAGMTRRQLAQASGTSERYLALIESGAGNPTIGVLGTLAAALDLPLVDLLPDGGERSAETARLTAAVRRLAPEGRAAFEAWLDQSARLAAGSAKAGRIVLIGLRGAGKTTLGRSLAERLAVPFIEMSKMVEDGYGGDIGLLIEMSGQAGLRRYESAVWDDICRRHDRAVIAAPGGIVADPALYARILARAHSIWLEATPDEHMARVMAQGDFRPMAENRGAMADLKAILAARGADYARADARVDTSGVNAEQALAKVVRCAEALLDIR